MTDFQPSHYRAPQVVAGDKSFHTRMFEDATHGSQSCPYHPFCIFRSMGCVLEIINVAFTDVLGNHLNGVVAASISVLILEFDAPHCTNISLSLTLTKS